MGNTIMKEQEAPSKNLAECYVTIRGERFKAIFAKNFEAKMNITTKEVPILGKTLRGHKVTGAKLKFSMTIYKVTEMFDDLVEEYKNTGLLPTFDIQVTNNDPATSTGRSTKIYKDCMIDGDILLSCYDAEGDFIEQTIEGYFSDFERPEKYKNIEGM